MCKSLRHAAKRGIRTQQAIPAVSGDVIVEAEVPVTGGYRRYALVAAVHVNSS